MPQRRQWHRRHRVFQHNRLAIPHCSRLPTSARLFIQQFFDRREMYHFINSAAGLSTAVSRVGACMCCKRVLKDSCYRHHPVVLGSGPCSMPKSPLQCRVITDWSHPCKLHICCSDMSVDMQVKRACHTLCVMPSSITCLLLLLRLQHQHSTHFIPSSRYYTHKGP